MDQIPALARVFAYLSLLTVGGGMAAFPEMKDQVVNVHQWLTEEQLVHVYSVGQMAPGPNMMMVATIGELVAKFPGALAAALAFFVPTAFLTLIVGRVWDRLANWPWRTSIQLGLAPVAIGLAVAGLLSLAKTSVTGPPAAAIMLAVFAATMRAKINPALLMLGAGVAGLFFFRV
jgi:chromate transporter